MVALACSAHFLQSDEDGSCYRAEAQGPDAEGAARGVGSRTQDSRPPDVRSGLRAVGMGREPGQGCAAARATPDRAGPQKEKPKSTGAHEALLEGRHSCPDHSLQS